MKAAKNNWNGLLDQNLLYMYVHVALQNQTVKASPDLNLNFVYKHDCHIRITWGALSIQMCRLNLRRIK